MIIKIPHTNCSYNTMYHQASCEQECPNCYFSHLGCSRTRFSSDKRNSLARMYIIDLLEMHIKELIKLL